MTTFSSPVVVIILYRTEIEWFEIISLLQVSKILGKHPFIAVLPKGISPRGLEFLPKHTKCCELDHKWFVSRTTYNKLLLNPDFYANFLEFKHILLFQLDAFVFSDRLIEFSSFEYDYMGAPWLYAELIQRYNFPFSIQISKTFCKLNPQLTCYVGNGGFSLRNPLACQQLLAKSSYFERKLSLNEDGFFAFNGESDKYNFKVAPLEVAIDFAWENYFNVCKELNQNRLPFGCHAWQKAEKQVIREYIVPFFEEHISVYPELAAIVDYYIGERNLEQPNLPFTKDMFTSNGASE